MNIAIPISRVSKDITATITVTGMRRFNVRCAVGMWLLRLGAWVLPIKATVEVSDGPA